MIKIMDKRGAFKIPAVSQHMISLFKRTNT